jgi:mannobiose 2-epimerase
MWWMQAEGLLGLANEALRSAEGHEMMIERAEACWNYIDRHVIDHENGDWFTAVDADGSPDFSQPKVGFWKEAYHQARMCLQLIEWARRQPG